MTMNNYNRRRFIQRSCQTIGTAGLALGVNPMLTLARAAESNFDASGDYRALVCIFLQGGSDGFSLFVPTANGEYQDYANSRKGLAVDRGNLLDLSTQSGPQMGIHSAAAPLQSLFNDGKLAMISNVGNLIEPTTLQQYKDKSVALPSQLFSHSDQEIQWQQQQGRGRGTEGWGAIAADYFSEYQQRDYLTSISLAGSNYWQAGYGQRPFTMKESGVLEYTGLDATNDWERVRAEAFNRVMQQPQSNIHAAAFADIQNRARNVTAELGAVLEKNSALILDQPEENTLSAKLSMVAQLIAARDQLGLRRQIFYVRMKGFDVHDSQNQRNAELFTELADGMSFFQNTLDQIGMTDQVTTFTASDFGRTLTSNGDGTDHGWGNHMMVMGGGVNGGQIYGDLPSMAVEGPDAVHNGRILPQQSASQYAATLLRWAGLQESQLNHVLPNLANFNSHDLGFMS